MVISCNATDDIVDMSAWSFLAAEIYATADYIMVKSGRASSASAVKQLELPFSIIQMFYDLQVKPFFFLLLDPL